jgi:hypothetical protein
MKTIDIAVIFLFVTSILAPTVIADTAKIATYSLSKNWSLDINKTAIDNSHLFINWGSDGTFETKNGYFQPNKELGGYMKLEFNVFPPIKGKKIGTFFFSTINFTSMDPAINSMDRAMVYILQLGSFAHSRGAFEGWDHEIQTGLGKERYWIESQSSPEDPSSNKIINNYFMPVTLEEGRRNVILSIGATNLSRDQWINLLGSMTLNRTGLFNSSISH